MKINKILLIIFSIIILAVVLRVIFIYLPSAKVIKSGYKVENNSVYIFDRIISKADSSTFVIIGDNEIFESGYSLGKDKSNVYVNGEVLDGYDPSTFVYLGGFYFKDKSHVYYTGGGTISSADANTFAYLKNYCAKDAKHVYYYGRIVISGKTEDCKLGSVLEPSNYAKERQNEY